MAKRHISARYPPLTRHVPIDLCELRAIWRVTSRVRGKDAEIVNYEDYQRMKASIVDLHLKHPHSVISNAFKHLCCFITH